MPSTLPTISLSTGCHLQQITVSMSAETSSSSVDFGGESSLLLQRSTASLCSVRSATRVRCQSSNLTSRSPDPILCLFSSTWLWMDTIMNQHVRRVRHLQLECRRFYDPVSPYTLSSFTEPAPMLESLDISTKYGSLLPSFCSDTLPGLRRLKLEGVCGWSEKQFSLSRLTHLHFVGARGCYGSIGSRRFLLDLLRDQQCLEELYMSRLDPCTLETNEEEARRIILPVQLRRFAMTDSNVEHISCLLSYLKIPRGTALCVTNPDDTFDIFPHSGDAIRFGDFSDAHFVRWTLYQEWEVVTTVGKSCAPCIGFNVMTEAGFRQYHSRRSTPSHWPFIHSIREFHLCLRNARFMCSNWAEVFTHLVSLQHLRVDNCAQQLHGILHSLTPAGVASQTRKPCIACRGLQSITINGLSYPRRLTIFFDLLFCVGTRNRLGIPIREIRIAPFDRKKWGEPLYKEKERKNKIVLTMLGVLDRYVDTMELNDPDELRWTKIPAHLNERVHETYWPKWE